MMIVHVFIPVLGPGYQLSMLGEGSYFQALLIISKITYNVLSGTLVCICFSPSVWSCLLLCLLWL